MIGYFLASPKTVSSLGYCSYVWIEITDKYCKGYEVYVDGVYQFTEGESGTPDGCCGFKVTPGYHTFKLTLNGKEVSKGWNCQCGVAYNWMSMNDMIPHWCEGGGGGNCDNPPTVNFDKSTYYEGDTVHITVSTIHSSVYYKIKDCSGTVRKNGYVSNGESIYYTIPSGASECCYWTICFYWDEYIPPIALAGAGGEVTAQSYECSKCYSFYVCPHETPCKVWIEVEDKYCKGYKVYVDGVYQFTEGESGTPDGYCRFWVTPGTHKFELRKNGCSVSKSWYCYCGTYYSWVSMNDMYPRWCECNKPTPPPVKEVKFRGTVTDIRGTTPWVQVDTVISGSEYISVGDYTDIACYTTAGETGPCGHCDIAKKGDEVEVYGKQLPTKIPMVTLICGKASYYMRLIGKPDLVIEDIFWIPLNPKLGDNITFTVKIMNQGTGNAKESRLAFGVSKKDANEYCFLRSSTIPSIATGGGYDYTVDYAMTECGIYRIGATADHWVEIEESNEKNNLREEVINIICPIKEKPDLVIQDITWIPSNPKLGDKITFTVKIKNQGEGNAKESRLAFGVSKKDANEYCFLRSSTIPSIATGGGYDYTVDYAMTECGIYRIGATADHWVEIEESDEENNYREDLLEIPCEKPKITISRGLNDSKPLEVFTRGSKIHVKLENTNNSEHIFSYLVWVDFNSDLTINKEDQWVSQYSFTSNKQEFDCEIPKDCPIGLYKLQLEIGGKKYISNNFFVIFDPNTGLSPQEIKNYWKDEETGNRKGLLPLPPKFETSHPSEEVMTCMASAASIYDQFPRDRETAMNAFQDWIKYNTFLKKELVPESSIKKLVLKIKSGEKTPGDCDVFSAFLVSLARASGIPARTISGSSIDYGWHHSWVEAYYGGAWQVWDPTWSVEFGTDYSGFVEYHKKNGDLGELYRVKDELGVDRFSDYTTKKEKPDLTIQDISWTPQNPKLGDNAEFAVTVKNIGKETAGKSHVFIVGINRGANKELFRIEDSCPSLKPGEIYTYYKNAKMENCGEYQLMAWADAGGEVNESNENNNYRDASFEIPCEKPELEKIWITGPDEIKAGETLQWQAYGSYSDETQKELTSQVSWTVDASDILQNKNIGKFNGLKGGEATLKIDYEGKSASKKVTVIEKENQPPKAKFTYEKDGLTVRFTSTSSDPDGDIKNYLWSFGDGGTSNQENPTYAYSSEGTYTVVLLVWDDKGKPGSDSEDITVTVKGVENQSPKASFTYEKDGLTVRFTSTSSDPDGDIKNYLWSFGDGGTSNQENPTYTYSSEGTYTVVLLVWDDKGKPGSDSEDIKVTVKGVENQSPKASFTYEKDGLTVRFTSTSSDPDGDIKNYLWSFGDGGTSNQENPTYTYSSEGTYTVVLLVWDDKGKPGSNSEDITVTEPKVSIKVTVKNLNNYPLPGCGGSITVKAHTDIHGKSLEEGSASYYGGENDLTITLNVPKVAKSITVWQTPKIKDGVQEYWGAMAITSEKKNEYNFVRHTPWITSITINGKSPYNELIDLNSPGVQTFYVQVTNPQIVNRKVKVEAFLDRDEKTPWDFNSNDLQELAPKESKEFSFFYNKEQTEGIWRFRIVVGMYSLDNKYVVTDQHDWYLLVGEKQIMRARSLQFFADYYIGILGKEPEDAFNKRMAKAWSNYTTEIGEITSKALATAYDPTAGKLIGIILDRSPYEKGVEALWEFSRKGLDAWSEKHILNQAEKCKIKSKLESLKRLAGEEVDCWKSEDRDIHKINKILIEEGKILSYVEGFTYRFGTIAGDVVPSDSLRKEMDKISDDMGDEWDYAGQTYNDLNGFGEYNRKYSEYFTDTCRVRAGRKCADEM